MNLVLQSPSLMGTPVDRVPVEYLDPMLTDDAGRLRAAFPASVFTALPPSHLKLWCHLRARYVLPTLELVTWLRARIAGRSALEIAAGNADLGYLAGIRETDSGVQQTLECRAYFRITGQPPTNPPPSVRRMDALAAIDKFKPKVVVAGWFTRKFEVGKDVKGQAQASVYGVREEEILERVETYIHAQKTILKIPHETIKFPGLLSRSDDAGTNIVQVWDRAS